MTSINRNTLQNAFYYLFLLQLVSIVFSIAIAQILYGFVFFLWLFIVSRQTKIEFTLFDAAFTAFVVLRIVTVLLSESPASSRIAYTREIAFYPYYFVALYYIKSFKIDGIKKAIHVLLYSSALASLYAVISVVSGVMTRGESLSGGYYVFSVHLAFVFAFSLAMIIDEKISQTKIFVVVAIVIIAAGILSTYTRSMWIAIALCVVTAGFMGYKKTLAGVTAAGVFFISLAPSLRDRLLTLLSPMEHSSGRIEIWKSGMEQLRIHPFFGFGPETFKNIEIDRSKFYDAAVASWHNEFLQIQIESGMFAALLLAILYGSVIWIFVKSYRQRKNSNGPNRNVELFPLCFLLFSLFVIIPAIATGSIMLSILNGMIVKFVFACASYFACVNNLLKTYTLRLRN